MKKLSKLYLILAICMVPAVVNAQLVDCWDASNWTINTAGTSGSVTIGTSDIVINNDLDFMGSGLDSIDCDDNMGTVTACITIPATGTMSFDWNVMMGFLSNPLVERYGYCLNGVATTLTGIDPPPFGTLAGSVTLAVTAGDEFCFVSASKFGDGGFASPYTINNFVLPACPSSCDASTVMTGMSSSVVGSTATVSWDAVSGAADYKVFGRVAGSTSAQQRAVPTNSLTVNLAPATTYEWVVRARCASGAQTPISSIQTLTTMSPRMENEVVTSVYPNPATEAVQVWTSADNAVVELYNTMGQLAKAVQVNGQSAMIDVSNLPSGAYIIVTTFDGNSTSERLIIE